MLSTSFTVKAPNVTVCEITGIKRGENYPGTLMVGLKEVISFQNRGHQHRVVDSLGENMEAGKEHPRGKEKGALQRRPVGCQTAPFLTLHNTCWACLGLERPTGRAGLSPMACWSLISPDPILH